MKRRTFCKSAVAAGIAATLPACGGSTNDSASIDAISTAGAEISLEGAAVDELAASLSGQLYRQSDVGYDTARILWNGMFDHKRPAMIAQCQSVDDVRNSVMFAAERGLLVSVKGGGHSLPGKSTSDGGMMIDMSQMHSASIDPDARTAHIGGGALLGHLDNAATEHDMITTTGIVSHTGVGGFTLGGGLGRVDRMFGLAIDNLLEATVVTASGDVVVASEEENADLFWGLRGGGGNFGVVTEFVYRLHPFNPMVYGGTLIFERSRELLDYYAEYCLTAPDEANVEPNFISSPDGTPIALIEFVYGGDHAKGAEVFAPWLELPGRLSGDFGPFPYREIQTGLDGIAHHGLQYYLKSGFVVTMTPELIEIMSERLLSPGAPDVWFQHVGGAIARVAPDATAYLHRDAAFNLGVMYTGDDPANNEAGIANVREFFYDVAPHLKGFYTNLNDEDEGKTWGNYGSNYPRLAELKAKYDPENLFRLNANINPAT